MYSRGPEVSFFFEAVAPALTPAERDFAEHLLKIWPNYRYDRSGLPKLNPIPAPGPASALAAAKAMNVLCRTRLAG